MLLDSLEVRLYSFFKASPSLLINFDTNINAICLLYIGFAKASITVVSKKTNLIAKICYALLTYYTLYVLFL